MVGCLGLSPAGELLCSLDIVHIILVFIIFGFQILTGSVYILGIDLRAFHAELKLLIVFLIHFLLHVLGFEFIDEIVMGVLQIQEQQNYHDSSHHQRVQSSHELLVDGEGIIQGQTGSNADGHRTDKNGDNAEDGDRDELIG